jgi:hypothetical protein
MLSKNPEHFLKNLAKSPGYSILGQVGIAVAGVICIDANNQL